MGLIKPTGEIVHATVNATGDAQPEHVLAPYTFSNAEGVDKVGTCTYDADTSDADLTVTEINGNCSSEEMMQGKYAYVKGKKVEGNLSTLIERPIGESTIYLNGSGGCKLKFTPTANFMMEARKEYIFNGYNNFNYDQPVTEELKSLTVNDVIKDLRFAKINDSNALITFRGTLPLATGENALTLDENGKYTFPARQAFEAGSVIVPDLSTATAADAVAREICMDKTAYVNGEKVTGTGLIYRNKNTIDNELVSYKQIYLLNLDLTANSFAMVCGWVNYVLDGVSKQIRFSGTLNSEANVSYGVSATACRLQAINGDENTLRLVLHFPLTGDDSFGSATDFDVHYYYRVF